MDLCFKQAEPADVETIKKLANAIWRQHYADIITEQQIDYMLLTRYSAEKINESLQSGEQYYLVVANEVPVGFASIEKQKQHWFLHKFYLLPAIQRKGAGTRFFHFLLAQMNYETVRLQVNRQNIKAINFYFKNGFTIEKAADFDIGNGYFMNDFVMVRKSTNQ